MSCTCNDETLTNKISCFSCKTEWSVPMSNIERVSICPKHKLGIAMCGGSGPTLCTDCTNQGYYVEREGSGWFPTFVVKRK